MQAGDNEKMQEQELKANGIAVLTLEHLGSSPDRLVSAVQKLMHQIRWADWPPTVAARRSPERR